MGSWFCLLMWSPTGSGGVFGVSGGQTELRELLPTGCVARDLMGPETSTGVPSNSSHGTLTSHTGCMNKSWSYLRGEAGGCFSFWLLSPLFSVLFAYLNLERKPLFIKAKSAMACMVQNQLSLKICARPFSFAVHDYSPGSSCGEDDNLFIYWFTLLEGWRISLWTVSVSWVVAVIVVGTISNSDRKTQRNVCNIFVFYLTRSTGKDIFSDNIYNIYIYTNSARDNVQSTYCILNQKSVLQC